MKRLAAAIALIIALWAPLTLGGWTVPKERLTYDIMYKWGLINKKAGSVDVTTYPQAGKPEFRAQLTGATAPWADRFYMVRDTLRGTIDSRNFLPSQYEKVAYEGGAYDRDILHYTRSADNSSTHATATLWRRKKKETEVTRLEKTYDSKGLTMDMLSAFYYMRQLPYDTMKPGETVRLTIFSGKMQEKLTIHYRGVENANLNLNGDDNGAKVPTYHITFTFTTQNGKFSTDNMDAWISRTPSRIPLLMEGKLPVGKCRAVYSGPLPR